MMNYMGKGRVVRTEEIIRGLLDLQKKGKPKRKKKASQWQYNMLVMLTLHKLEGGSLVIRNTDLGVLVSMADSELWLLFNKGKVKGAPKFNCFECAVDEKTLPSTKGSTRWLETLMRHQREIIEKCSG